MANVRQPTPESDVGSNPVGAVLQRIDESWRGWLDAVAAIPSHRLTDPGVVGDWSPKDLFGHVAFWDSDTVEPSRRMLGGKSPWQNNWEAKNRHQAAARGGRTTDALREEMMRSHDAMLAFMSSLRPGDLDVPAVEFRIRVDTFEHSDDHAAEGRAWRRREGL